MGAKEEHAKKVKMARKMRSKAEIKAKTPIFQTKAWENRKLSRQKKWKGE